MGTDIGAILQRKTDVDTEWVTVAEDLFYRNRAFFEVLQKIGDESLTVSAEFKLLGDWGHGSCTLLEFCTYQLPPPPAFSERFCVEKTDSGLSVDFFPPEDLDEYDLVRSMQKVFEFTFFDLTEYRLVYAFDS